MPEQEQPTIYKSAILMLVEAWRSQAAVLRRDDTDVNEALSYCLQVCADQLEGLANIQ